MSCINIGKDRQVFWDNYLVDEEKTSAFQRVLSPQQKDICFNFDQKYEINSISYPCIVKDDKGYKMYYQPWDDELKPKVCVIESTDGINWHRPNLNIFDIPELKENNVVIEKVKDGIFVFYDTNPNCPTNEKYKAIGSALMLHPDGETKTSLCCYVSPDGYHFTLSHPMTRYGAFDSLNTAMWDGKRYVCYYRSFHNIPGVDNSEILDLTQLYAHKIWLNSTRDIRVMYSDDFRNWTLPEMITFDDGLDYPLYTNNIEIYERAPVFIGFPVRYFKCEDGWTKNIEQMTGYETRKNATKKVEDRTGLVNTDCVFICSHDGKNFHRSSEAFATPGYETVHNWIYGDCYFGYSMIDSGKEYYNMYTIDHHFSFDSPKPLVRYEIRKDGFACYMADCRERTLVTKPIVFDGKELHINFETSGMGYIYISILDEDYNEISNGESFRVFGNNIDRKIAFNDSYDLSAFQGKNIRIKFRMMEAKLYSMKFD